ncbi:hypothetical protein PWT90_05630 [Aphanocladium album]|nr:hypothetical protein PWT90_05630 [Aphanocladium album]
MKLANGEDGKKRRWRKRGRGVRESLGDEGKLAENSEDELSLGGGAGSTGLTRPLLGVFAAGGGRTPTKSPRRAAASKPKQPTFASDSPPSSEREGHPKKWQWSRDLLADPCPKWCRLASAAGPAGPAGASSSTLHSDGLLPDPCPAALALRLA